MPDSFESVFDAVSPIIRMSSATWPGFPHMPCTTASKCIETIVEEVVEEGEERKVWKGAVGWQSNKRNLYTPVVQRASSIQVIIQGRDRAEMTGTA